jgi:2-hydroxychromene-2-carboxylate isomerase
MTLNVDLYYTMRSPYCYLSTPQLSELVATYDLVFELKPVYPLAISDPTFFARVNPMWPPYLFKDTARIAQRLGIPFRWPQPDPVQQNMQTKVLADEQPYIRNLSCLAQIAAEQGRGLEFVASVSKLIFSPDIAGWDSGHHLADAVAAAGLNLADMNHIIEQEGPRLDAALAANRASQLACGHWGAPLFVFEGEIFFGQDRVDDLVWHLQNNGLTRR